MLILCCIKRITSSSPLPANCMHVGSSCLPPPLSLLLYLSFYIYRESIRSYIYLYISYIYDLMVYLGTILKVHSVAIITIIQLVIDVFGVWGEWIWLFQFSIDVYKVHIGFLKLRWCVDFRCLSCLNILFCEHAVFSLKS